MRLSRVTSTVPRSNTHDQHAIDRAYERYSVTLTSKDLNVLSNQIKMRDAKRAHQIDNTTWRVLHGTLWMMAVIKRGRIRTFLPKDENTCPPKPK